MTARADPLRASPPTVTCATSALYGCARNHNCRGASERRRMLAIEPARPSVEAPLQLPRPARSGPTALLQTTGMALFPAPPAFRHPIRNKIRAASACLLDPGFPSML